MSGIFAYIGRKEPKEVLLKGLSALQHRGGEVNGISVMAKDGFASSRTVGSVDRIAEEEGRITTDGCCGLAETSLQQRCVGAASLVPALNGEFTVACDGNILNFQSLRRHMRTPQPVSTDEDLLLACLCLSNGENKIELANKTAKLFSGAPSFAFIPKEESAVYANAGSSMLFVGIGEEGTYLSSELAPLFSVCEKFAILTEGETVRLRMDRAIFYDEKCRKIKKPFNQMPNKVYFQNSFTLQDEIRGCALAAREIFSRCVRDSKLDFGELKITKRSVEKLSRIVLVGEGTSYNVALYARGLFEALTDIPAFAYHSGEYMYASGVVDRNTLLIAVSERGETKNTLSCVRRAKSAGAKTLALTGSDISSLAIFSDKTLATEYDFTGGISLRSFVFNSMAAVLLALYFGVLDDVVSDLYLSVALKMAELLSGKISTAVKDNTAYATAVNLIAEAENIYTAGVGLDYAAALEAADKIRLVSGKNCAAFPLSELLGINKNLLQNSAVLAFVSNRDRAAACELQLSRLKAIGARIVLLTTENIEDEMHSFDTAISVNDTVSILNPIPCVAASYKLSSLIKKETADEDDNEQAAS